MRSIGRNTGSIKVRSRLNTRVMKIPTGFVTSRTSAKNRKIWNHPFAVISEFLRTQECVDQVHRSQDADHEHDPRFQAHILLLTSRAHRSAHTQSTRQKKRSLPIEIRYPP